MSGGAKKITMTTYGTSMLTLGISRTISEYNEGEMGYDRAVTELVENVEHLLRIKNTVRVESHDREPPYDGEGWDA